MRRRALSVGGWFGAACLLVTAWSCSGSDTNPFGNARRGSGGSGGTSGSSGGGTSGSSGGGTAGSSAGTDSGSSGASGTSTGGEANGGMTTGGSTGDGGAAADSGSDAGGTTSGDAGMGGSAGTPAVGGSGMSGSPTGGAGASAGAGMSGGAGNGGMSGTGGTPGGCKENTDCGGDEYCRKESCDAEYGECEERGPECRGYDAEFAPVCGCDGMTYWNTCVIEHEGFNVARAGECTDDDDRPTCTRAEGGDSCPAREHAHCYRPVAMCGDPSPTMGVCWVLPTECPDFEPRDQRYCGGTDGEARCISLCEVIDAENSFRRDAPTCED